MLAVIVSAHHSQPQRRKSLSISGLDKNINILVDYTSKTTRVRFAFTVF